MMSFIFNIIHYITCFKSFGINFKLKSNHKVTKHVEVIYSLMYLYATKIVVLHIYYGSNVPFTNLRKQILYKKVFGSHKNCGLEFKFDIKDSNQIEKRF